MDGLVGEGVRGFMVVGVVDAEQGGMSLRRMLGNPQKVSDLRQNVIFLNLIRSGSKDEKFRNEFCYNYHNYMKRLERAKERGATLVEILCAALLLAVFFASIFELNAVCLRYIDASKESVAALEEVHDRCEALRNLAFSDLTNTSYLQTLLAAPANSSDFCKKATEVVAISAYPTANGVTAFTRSPSGTVTRNSTAGDLGSALVKVDVAASWNLTLNGRLRSEQTSTIISNGTKK